MQSGAVILLSGNGKYVHKQNDWNWDLEEPSDSKDSVANEMQSTNDKNIEYELSAEEIPKEEICSETILSEESITEVGRAEETLLEATNQEETGSQEVLLMETKQDEIPLESITSEALLRDAISLEETLKVEIQTEEARESHESNWEDYESISQAAQELITYGEMKEYQTEVTEEIVYMLPETGGSGVYSFQIIGFMCLCAAVIFCRIKRIRKRGSI